MGDARNRLRSENYLFDSDRIGNLLAAAVDYTGGKVGYLIPLKGELLLPGIAFRHCGQPATEPLLAAELAPHEIFAISRAMTKYRAALDYATAHAAKSDTLTVADNSTNFCIVMATSGTMSFVLYVEVQPEDERLHEHTTKALKLFGLALLEALRCRADGNQDTTAGARELSLSHLHSELESKNKLVQNLDPCILSGLAESVAIEVNDPLSAVVAHASAGLEWLSQEPPKIDKARSSLRKIAASTFAAGRVISAYRSVADPNRLGVQNTELKELVGRALDLIGPEMRANNVTCQCDFSGESVVCVEAPQIEQAIVNLASVAISEMKNTEGPRELRLSAVRQGTHVQLSLSDTSLGIQPDAQDAIFDPTYTAKDGGRGIKLAIARTIAQLHGGSLDIARSDAAGTTMFLRLPVAR